MNKEAGGEELVFDFERDTEKSEKVRWAIGSAFMEPSSFTEMDGKQNRIGKLMRSSTKGKLREKNQ